MKRWKIGGGLLALVLLCASPILANPITFTFGELPFQPVNGLSFQGVTFTFQIGGLPSLDANYNSAGPGIITFVQDPSLEGDAAGILTLDFAQAASSLQFGVALSTGAALAPGFTVLLFDQALLSLGATLVNTNPLITFTEAQFSYTGVPVSRAVIDFNQAAASRFALDNLIYTPIPEPGTMLLLGTGLLGLGSTLRKRFS